jgi:hypothetical protein
VSHRWVVACAAVILFVGGCSSSKDGAPASAGSASASVPSAESSMQNTGPAPTPLGDVACKDIGAGDFEMTTAKSKADARQAADKMEKYNPPDNVKAAIEHFVDTEGPKDDDPDAASNSYTLAQWAKAVCPY